jgi:hypothetical protein
VEVAKDIALLEHHAATNAKIFGKAKRKEKN